MISSTVFPVFRLSAVVCAHVCDVAQLRVVFESQVCGEPEVEHVSADVRLCQPDRQQ